MAFSPLKILFEDERFIAVHKPAGMLVHRTDLDPRERRVCLQVLRDQIGREVYPCHRLDRPTSGVLLFALDREALNAANEAFANGQIEKTYQAVVRGWLPGEGKIDHPMSTPKDMLARDEPIPPARPAVTYYRCLEHLEAEEPVGPHPSMRVSLLELRPKTGRTHQIRRHLKHLSHPIVGDTRYGDGRVNRFFREHLTCHRLLLVATGLAMEHPFSGKLVTVETHPDVDFQAVLVDTRWTRMNG